MVKPFWALGTEYWQLLPGIPAQPAASNFLVIGERLPRRILAVLTGIFICLLLAAAVQSSNAAPIRPDLKQVLAGPPEDKTQFPLARAGWDGPETQRNRTDAANPTLERLGPAATARAVRAELVSAAIPDYRAVAGILLVILLLRRIRKAREQQRRLAHVVPFPESGESRNERTA